MNHEMVLRNILRYGILPKACEYLYFLMQGGDLSEAQEGDPKYLAPELMEGQFSKPADIFR